MHLCVCANAFNFLGCGRSNPLTSLFFFEQEHSDVCAESGLTGAVATQIPSHGRADMGGRLQSKSFNLLTGLFDYAPTPITARLSCLREQRFKAKSAIGQHPESRVPFDPNNEHDQAAIRYWIAFADFYQWPHITQFSNWDDLMTKMQAADLSATSEKMQQYNAETKEKLFSTWSAIFHKMFNGIAPAAQKPRPQLMDFDASMKAMYGAKVHGGCVGDTHTRV